MKTRYLVLSAVALVIFVGLLLIFVVRKTIIINIDEEQREITTQSLTVSGALRQAQIPLHPEDSVSLNLNQMLRDGDTITIERASQIHILDDGESYIFMSAERSPANLLTSLDISIYPDDRIVVNGLPYYPESILPYLPTHSIQIIRATPISVSLKGDQLKFNTSVATLGQALWKNGIHLYTKDNIEPAINTLLDKPLQAKIQPSREIEIQEFDREIIERTSASNVGQALTDIGLPLQGLDYSIPHEDEALPSDGKIQLVRVKEEVIVETSPIPTEIQYQPASDVAIDNQQLIQPGEFGLIAQRIRIRYENDIEVKRTTESEYIAKEPSARIIGYGTKIEPQTVSTPEGQIQYWRALEMYAVSYNPSSAGGTVTATGLPLQKGVAAIDPRYIPFGTHLFIPGYGEAVAADTGPGITPRMIDLGYSNDDYVAWHQPVTVYFLWPPPENIVWIIP
jgi:uncharacterized protein YabE (DUF348 family)